MHVTVSDEERVLMAIGRVAVESAKYEHELRSAHYVLLGTDGVWTMIEGQNADWLCETLKALVRDRAGFLEDDEPLPTAHAKATTTVAAGLALLRLRNVVIHGIWSTEILGEEHDGRAPRTLPWGRDAASGRRWSCRRSRRRQEYEEHVFTAGDLERLASELKSARSELRQAIAGLGTGLEP